MAAIERKQLGPRARKLQWIAPRNTMLAQNTQIVLPVRFLFRVANKGQCARFSQTSNAIVSNIVRRPITAPNRRQAKDRKNADNDSNSRPVFFQKCHSGFPGRLSASNL